MYSGKKVFSITNVSLDTYRVTTAMERARKISNLIPFWLRVVHSSSVPARPHHQLTLFLPSDPCPPVRPEPSCRVLHLLGHHRLERERGPAVGRGIRRLLVPATPRRGAMAGVLPGAKTVICSAKYLWNRGWLRACTFFVVTFALRHST